MIIWTEYLQQYDMFLQCPLQYVIHQIRFVHIKFAWKFIKPFQQIDHVHSAARALLRPHFFEALCQTVGMPFLLPHFACMYSRVFPTIIFHNNLALLQTFAASIYASMIYLKHSSMFLWSVPSHKKALTSSALVTLGTDFVLPSKSSETVVF